MNKTLVYQLIIGLVIGAVLFLVGNSIIDQPYQYQGSIIDPPVEAADFQLKSSDGSKFQLQNFRGKFVLLYFGYTFCPDVCPTTLYDLSRVKNNLGEKADDMVVAMITVDPERDALDTLGKYVTTFDPSFYGLSADIKTLEKVWADYGVYRDIREVAGSAGYLVDHTARIYVIDRQGRLRITFPFGMLWEGMADDLSHLLNE
jgi:protein SCO1/2